METLPPSETVYQIANWDSNYENNKSRGIDECSFVCVPNKQDGMGFLNIMAQKDGAAIYGIWHLILGACSRQKKPRLGWLTDNGTATGQNWLVESMAMRWRRSKIDILRALQVLTSPNVGWVNKLQRPTISSAHLVPDGAGWCPSGAIQCLEEKEGREGRNRTEEKGIALEALSVFPSALNHPEFVSAWERWVPFRTGLGKIGDAGAREIFFNGQLEWLSGFGLKTATSAVLHSVNSGYRGLFPDKFSTATSKNAAQLRREQQSQREFPENIEVKSL